MHIPHIFMIHCLFPAGAVCGICGLQRIGKKALLSPWLLSGTVSSELWYFWHMAGTHTQCRLTGATVGFPDDQRFRETLRWTYFWEYKKKKTRKRFLCGIFADTLPFPVILFNQQNLVTTLISYVQNKFMSKLQCADYVTLLTMESLQWLMCQMRSNVTHHSEMKRVHILCVRVH